MLANLVQETANNPGQGNVVLGGAPANRFTFLQAFGADGPCYYVITDGVQTEWGEGVVQASSPPVLLRSKVLGTNAGHTNRLNFTGAVTVYNEAPAERTALIAISHLRRTSVFNVSSGAEAVLAFNETGTNSAGAAPTGGGNGFTLPRAGFWRFNARATFVTSTGGVRRFLSLRVTDPNGTTSDRASDDRVPLAGRPTPLAVEYADVLPKGTQVVAMVFQDSGGLLALSGFAEMTGQWLSA